MKLSDDITEDDFTSTPDSRIWDLSPIRLGAAKTAGEKRNIVTVTTVNTDDGNAAAAGYGVVRGVGRSATRHIAGFLEIVLWPFPAWRKSYYPLLPSDIPWIHADYSEFPPELGNESKYPYVRDY